ncbi:MAG: 50S ribosome-binding GTPase [Prochloraceae cyanobacterium]|nr:50S ribosome-binding GTPase [Prochloraceae cyanobacterium]
MSDEKISIAVAGHTNSGKTTLIRSLMKSNVGTIGDRANVTKFSEENCHDGLQATFIDCPGFTKASDLLKYIKLKKEKPDLLSQIASVFNPDKFVYDERAINAIKNSDVVFYLANLETIPEDDHDEEIELIRSVHNKIIGIGNKSRKRGKKEVDEKLSGRIHQWESFFRKNEILNFIMFDTFWDNPSKIISIYGFVKELLSDNERKAYVFDQGLKRYYERQIAIFKESSDLLAECVIKCREIKKSADESKKSRTSLQEEAKKELESTFKNFVKDIEKGASHFGNYKEKAKSSCGDTA